LCFCRVATPRCGVSPLDRIPAAAVVYWGGLEGEAQGGGGQRGGGQQRGPMGRGLSRYLRL
jgi:hypothetical protein